MTPDVECPSSPAPRPRLILQLAKWLEDRNSEPPVIQAGAISDVVAVGSMAYKIKRPIRSQYVHYDSLEARRHFCVEEVRLNTRFWPTLYRGVVPITGTADGVELDGPGPVVDWAVAMTRFRQSDLLTARPASVAASQLFAFGTDLAKVHSESLVIRHGDAGSAASTIEWMTECLETIARAGAEHLDSIEVPTLVAAIQSTVAEMAPLLDVRRSAGWTREIHGDLHPGNLVWHDDRIRAFDCLEYCELLRHLDVLVDLAFATLGVERLWGSSGAQALIAGWRSVLDEAYDRRVFALYRAGRRLVEGKVAALMLSVGLPTVGAGTNAALRDAQAMFDAVGDPTRWE